MKAKLHVLSLVAIFVVVLSQASIWNMSPSPLIAMSLPSIGLLDVKLEHTSKAPEVVNLVLGENSTPGGDTEVAKLFVNFLPGVPQRIDLNVDDGTRERLSEREWQDQVRDWLLLAVVGDSGLSAYDIGGTLFDLPPLRYGYLKASGQFEYGKSRSSYIGGGRIVALVPAGISQAARDDAISDVIDRHRKDQAGEITSVELFEYRFLDDRLTAELTQLSSLDVTPYLTTKKGYHKATVASLDDLGRLLQQIDDLTYAEITPKGLLLGGRKLRSYQFHGIGLQEVAAIWQSEQDIADKEREFQRIVEAEETAYRKRWSYKLYSTNYEKSQLEARADRDWKQVEKKIQQRARELRIVDGSGFSLDPTYDFAGLQLFVSELLAEAEQLDTDTTAQGVQSAAINTIITPIQRKRPQFEKAAEALAKEDIVPLLKVSESLKNSSNSSDSLFALALESAYEQFKFQAARYDGKLQGTEAGMVLFYTDLLAKIWAINYLDSAPIDRISGFVDHTRVQNSPIYTRESRELSEARLWFGPPNQGFQVAQNNDKLYFQRVSTRVYSKGHNPLDPANEVQTSAFLAAPIDWWDDHYEEVARYEPEYFRLNEIMKWSLLIGFLTEGGNGDRLRFLDAVEVDRSNWFPTWASDNKALRFDLWDKIAFYERGFKGVNTEAMEFLWGEVTAGGVSLAPKTLFRKRTQIAPSLSKLHRRSTIDYTGARLGAGEFKTLDGVAVKLQRRGLEKVFIQNTPKPDLRLRAVDSDLVNGPFERVITKTSNRLKVRADAGGTRLGELNIERNANGFKIGWQARDIDAGQTLALRASRSNRPEVEFARDPLVEQLVKLADPETYAVKLRNSDKWMVVGRGGGDASTVGGGWQSRVADPKKGGASFQLKWVEKSDVEEQIRKSDWMALRPSSDGKSVIADIQIRGPPKRGTTNVQLVTGKKPLAATVENSTGIVYISKKDLQGTTSLNLLDLPRRLGPEQFQEIRALSSTAQDGGHIALGNPRHTADTLKSGDGRRVAAEIIAAPEKASRALNQALANDLGAVSKLVGKGEIGSALSQLARMRQVYGPQPELKLWGHC